MQNSVKLNFLSEPKDEDKYLQTFINHYYPKYYHQLSEENVYSPDSVRTNGRAPDYYLEKSQILIELKRVIDKREQEVEIAYIKNLARLNNELNKRDKNSLDGFYFVRIPMGLRIARGNESFVIDQIWDSIKSGKPEASIQNIAPLEIKKLGNKDKKDILLSFGSRSGSINSAQTIFQNTKNLIYRANEQLGNFTDRPISKKILLLINKYAFGETNDYFTALSNIFDNTINYENLDEIWLQANQSHELLIEKEFLNAYKNSKFIDLVSHIELFRKWLNPDYNQTILVKRMERVSKTRRICKITKSLFSVPQIIKRKPKLDSIGRSISDLICKLLRFNHK
jgi:hypothetical protein